MTITINQGMLNRITDDVSDGWSGAITFSMNVDPGNIFQDIGDFVGFNIDPDITPMSQANMDAMVEIAELWDDLIARDISFVFNNDDEDIIVNSITNMPSYAAGFTYNTIHSILPNDADIFLKPNAIVAGLGSWKTAVHEFGHALGLMHPGEYNADDGNLTYEDNAEFPVDTAQFSIMSYFEAGSLNPAATWSRTQTLTPMVYDILAIQNYYGIDTTTRLGDTTYGFNSTAGRAVYAFNADAPSVLTIWDAGGTHDRLDASGYGAEQSIDLSEGSYSDIGGLVANIGIAFHTFIEDAIGGSGDDTIQGNPGHNRLDGGAADDELYGLVGYDTLIGGAGADDLYGATGDDVLTGGDSGDLIYGGDGFDTALYTSAGGEVITITPLGTPGNGLWRVDGWAEATGDTLSRIEAFGFGNGGDDITIANGPGANGLSLDAAGGNDSITGSNGLPDVENLTGGAGSDTIDPMRGQFNANGGAPGAAPNTWIESLADNDLLVLDRSSYHKSFSWNVAFPTGVPLGLYNGTDFSTARGFARLDYQGSGFQDFINGHLGNDRMRGFGGNDVFAGNTGHDTLEGGSGADSMHGQGGNDILRGGLGVDDLRGGPDNDRIETGGGGDFHVIGEAGNDTIIGFTAGEVLDGGTGNDSIQAGGGGDVLFGGTGNDTVSGGSGNDTINPGLGVEDLDGGGDVNRLLIDRSATTRGVTFFLNGAAGSDGTIAVNFATMAYAAGGGNDLIRGSGDNDAITGNLGRDTLEGGLGANSMHGEGGNDTLRGGLGLDDLRGGTGHDRIETGGGGDFQIIGEAGNDTIIGAAEAEVLDGGANNDSIQAGGGSDLLRGGSGNDTVKGGAGNDTVNPGLGVESLDGGDNVDHLIVDRSSTTLGVTFNLNGPAGSDGTLAVEFETLAYAAGTGNDLIRGAGGIDVIAGNLGRDTLEGGLGADSMYGEGGNDTLRGGLGLDDLRGGIGDDRIETGGGGDFQIMGETGNDTIIGSIDAEVLSGGGDDDSIQAGGGGDFLQGDAGNDTLDGGIGNDTMIGGADADRFTFATALSAATNLDRILDFIVADDRIALQNSIFTGLAAGILAAGQFRLGTAAADANDRIIYDAATGALIFDANGNAAGRATQFAVLASVTGILANTDFLVI